MRKWLDIGILLFVMMSAEVANAQVKGVNMVTRLNYHTNDDVTANVEKVKSRIDRVKDANALAKVSAKVSATHRVRREHQRREKERLLKGLQDGESHQYMKLDMDSNRMAVFSPQQGRVIVTDWRSKRVVTAYPKLKLAVVYTLNVEIAKKNGSQDVYEFLSTDSIPEGMEVETINGFMAVPVFAYRDAELGTEPENTLIIHGKLKEVFPMPGHLLVKNEHEYYRSIYVEGYNNKAKESIEAELEMFEETSLDARNFNMPKDYKILTTQKDIDKELTPLLQKNKQVMDDPSQMPDVFW